MPPATSLASHQPYLDTWQRALDSERGILVRVEDQKAAIDYRGRLYHARQAERNHNLKAYPSDNVMHGRSYYDALIVKLVPEGLQILKPDDIQAEIVEL
jgi:hypothetical protein